MRGKKISTDLKYTVLALGDFHSVETDGGPKARREFHVSDMTAVPLRDRLE